MANLIQLKMLEDLDGILLVDKPEGIAFSTVIKTVKRKFNLVKVGHGGSLESMASGLLVLLINGANKFVGEIMDVKVTKSCLSAEGLPDPSLLDALHYAPLLNEYYATGDFVAKAFAVGKTVKRQN
jgi:hypothetical protein